MKSDRLVVLMAPEQKARLAAAARARHLSVGELVRSAVARFDAPPSAERTGAEKLADQLISLGFRKVRDDDHGGEWWCSAEGSQFYILPDAGDPPDVASISSGGGAGVRATATPGKPEPSEAEQLKVGASSLMLQADEAAALERLAGVALQTLKRANVALDEAFEEIEATKAYFAAKRSAAAGDS